MFPEKQARDSGIVWGKEGEGRREGALSTPRIGCEVLEPIPLSQKPAKSSRASPLKSTAARRGPAPRAAPHRGGLEFQTFCSCDSLADPHQLPTAGLHPGLHSGLGSREPAASQHRPVRRRPRNLLPAHSSSGWASPSLPFCPCLFLVSSDRTILLPNSIKWCRLWPREKAQYQMELCRIISDVSSSNVFVCHPHVPTWPERSRGHTG